VPFRTLHKTRWFTAPILGVVATLGYAPYGQWYLSLLALALMFAIAARAPAGRAAFLGWLYGFAHYLTGIYWVYISTHVYGGAPAWLGALLMVTLAAYLAAYDAIGFALAARLRLFHAPIGWAAVPALWVLLELLRGSWLFKGFPWLSYGELALDTPVAGLAPLVGVHGISALVVLCALALQKIGVEDDRRRRLIAAAALASPLLTILLPAPSSYTEVDGPPITAALVQSDIRQDEKWLPNMRFEALSRHWRLTQQAWPASVVVWPEVALTQSYAQLKDNYLAKLDEQAAARKATLLLGILAFDENSTDPKKPPYNSVVAVGAEHGRYDKRHLVPDGRAGHAVFRHGLRRSGAGPDARGRPGGRGLHLL
jgi:apolipoprotein N-acyltransferase